MPAIALLAFVLMLGGLPVPPVAADAKTPGARSLEALPQQWRTSRNSTGRLRGLRTTDKAIVFAAPPRETKEAAHRRYEPIAAYLSRVLGRPVVYRYPDNWSTYRAVMLKGGYDLIFDSAHFNGYRIQELGHNVLAKAPAAAEFAVIIKKGEKRYRRLASLAGRTICAAPSPHLGTLTVLNEFKNPSRQPLIVNTAETGDIFKGVNFGRCAAGIVPLGTLNRHDPGAELTTVLFRTRPLPNQAFSAGPRLSREEQRKIARALIAPAAREPTARLRAALGLGEGFIRAANSEYAALASILKGEWGY